MGLTDKYELGITVGAPQYKIQTILITNCLNVTYIFRV